MRTSSFARGALGSPMHRAHRRLLTKLHLERLEERRNPTGLVVGASASSAPIVTILNDAGDVVKSFQAYGPNVTGGVNVAKGDVNGDGVDDIITAPASGSAPVRVFDGTTYELLKQFRPFSPFYRGGVEVAYGHFDSAAGDIIVSTSRRAGVVKVYDVAKLRLVRRLTPYGSRVDGVNITVAQLDAEPNSEIVTAPGGGVAPVVKGYDFKGARPHYRFTVMDSSYRGPVMVAAGDYNGDRQADLITAPGGAGAAPEIRLWTKGADGKPVQVGGFTPFADAPNGLVIGTLERTGARADRIVAAPVPATASVSLKADGTTLTRLDENGHVLGSIAVPGVGSGVVSLTSAPEDIALAYNGPRSINAVDYSPTWPFWAANDLDKLPKIQVTERLGSNSFSYKPLSGTVLWSPQFLMNQVLFQNGNPQFFYYITDVTYDSGTQSGTITIGPASGNQNIPPVATTLDSGVGSNTPLVVLVDQLHDSDFYNATFQGLWSTPRVEIEGTQYSDLQAMKQIGFDTIRLYDWNPQRGFTSLNGGTSDHAAFLQALDQLGMKVIVPVSNYNLTDNTNLWKDYVPSDGDYSFSKAPQTIRDQLTYFIKSITASNGKLDPAVSFIEVGNEIDLDAGGNSNQSMTTVTLRTMWWVVNLQRQLQSQGLISATDPNRPRFTIPVSNADQGSPTDPQFESRKSWFQVFRNGADAGSLTPTRSTVPSNPRYGQKFTDKVPGLAELLGDTWYQTWFVNSYQTFKRGDDLKDNIFGLYNSGGSRDPQAPWNTAAWPGMKFDVPLLLTELGWSIFEARSEGEFYDAVTKEQAQVAQDFLSTQQKSINPSFIGWAFFEFGQEPNKNNNFASPGDSEQTRGVFKYYSSRNVNDFRPTTPPKQRLASGLTSFPFLNFKMHSVTYPIYTMFPITSDSGVELPTTLRKILKKV